MKLVLLKAGEELIYSFDKYWLREFIEKNYKLKVKDFLKIYTYKDTLFILEHYERRGKI